MQIKSAEVKKNSKAKQGIAIDYSLPDEGDWDELKEITGVGQDNVFEYIVAQYERRLLSSMRIRFFPVLKNIVHPKSGEKFKVSALDHKDKEAVAAAIQSVKLIKPKTTRAKPISSQDAWQKIENDLRAAGVSKDRIEEFKRQRQELVETAENAATAD
jgi:hypothetical protein